MVVVGGAVGAALVFAGRCSVSFNNRRALARGPRVLRRRPGGDGGSAAEAQALGATGWAGSGAPAAPALHVLHMVRAQSSAAGMRRDRVARAGSARAAAGTTAAAFDSGESGGSLVAVRNPLSDSGGTVVGPKTPESGGSTSLGTLRVRVGAPPMAVDMARRDGASV
jgi:hypothetical protein